MIELLWRCVFGAFFGAIGGAIFTIVSVGIVFLFFVIRRAVERE